MEKRKSKIAYVVLNVITVIFIAVIATVTGVVMKNNYDGNRNSKLGTVKQNCEFLIEKINLVCSIAPQTQWASLFSTFGEEELENVPFPDVFEAQSNIRSYNAIIGFGCEIIVMFDKGKHALTATGKVNYENLQYRFDGGEGLVVANAKSDVYGNITYSNDLSVIDAIVYAKPESFNKINMRYLFVLDKQYVEKFLKSNLGKNDGILFSYKRKSLIRDANFRQAKSVTDSFGDFEIGLYSEFPALTLVLILAGEIAVMSVIYIAVRSYINSYTRDMQGIIKKLNAIAGKEPGDGSNMEEFDRLLIELSEREKHLRETNIENYGSFLKEYLRFYLNSGNEMRSEIKSGLIFFGLNANKPVQVAYFGSFEKNVFSDDADILDIGEAVIYFTGDDIERKSISCKGAYGISEKYLSFNYLRKAYEEAKQCYEIAVLYEKDVLSVADIGKLKAFPVNGKDFLFGLNKDIIKKDYGLCTERLSDLSGKFKAAEYVSPAEIYGFFTAAENMLCEIDGQEINDRDYNGKSIFERIELLSLRIGEIVKKQSVDGDDKYRYYFLIIKDYIDAHYTEPDLSLQVVADHFNYSVAYISRIFSEYGQFNYLEYISAKRVELAKKLMRTTSLSVKDVAARCGIDSMVTFRRVFKKYAGVLPSEYCNAVDGEL